MNKFFLTGPNRTGTTLLARCIDDHPKSVCLFETNIHITMLGGKGTVGHSGRMAAHGLDKPQTKDLIQKADGSVLDWYDHCAELLKTLYKKPDLTHIGDKNPFFYNHAAILKRIKACPKIWTIRDPRAIWYSRHLTRKKDSVFFQRYIDNVRYFIKKLDTSLVIRFEDLILEPEQTMGQAYDYLGLEYDESFLNRSEKPHDRRFKWNPNSLNPFDKSKLKTWKNAKRALPSKFFTPLVKEVMETFNYE